MAAQGHVDGIEEVGTHHRYLVDDEQFEGAYNIEFLAAERLAALGQLVFGDQFLDVGQVWVEGQLEEAVYGDAAGVDGGDARGCHDDVALGAVGGEVVEEGGLARTGLAGEEEAHRGLLDVAPCQLNLRVAHEMGQRRSRVKLTGLTLSCGANCRRFHSFWRTLRRVVATRSRS